MAGIKTAAVALTTLWLMIDLRIVIAFTANTAFFRTRPRPPCVSPMPLYLSTSEPTTQPYLGDEEEEDNTDDDSAEWVDSNAELVTDDFYEDQAEEAEWMPDREKARQKREAQQQQQSQRIFLDEETSTTDQSTKNKAYTQEEEELIAAMGGKQSSATTTRSKREEGFLGDSTLKEIATDYSVPVCYLADVLCMWGVPVPIDINDRLGDLVTGEQAFAIVEAIYSLDVSALHDRYSNQSLMSVCDDYDIDLKEAFQMAVKEGWSLPFGVQTCLRVEQEEELTRVLGSIG